MTDRFEDAPEAAGDVTKAIKAIEELTTISENIASEKSEVDSVKSRKETELYKLFWDLMRGWGDVINRIDERVRGLKGDVVSSVGSLNEQVTGLKGDVVSSVGSLNRQVTGLKGDVVSSVGSLNRQVTGLKGDVDSSVGSLNRQVTGLKGDVDRGVGGLNRQVAVLQKDVNGLQGQVKALQKRLVGFEKAHREETTKLRKTFLTGSGIAVGATGILVVGLQSILASCGG